MTLELEKLRAVLRDTRFLQFNEHSAEDLWDRLGLLTVVAGLREVAAFGFGERANEGRLRAIKDCLGNFGLPTQITRQVRSASHHRSVGRSVGIAAGLAEVFDRVDEESYEKNTGRLLWVCRNPKTREQIKRAVAGEIPTGTLLGYPKCCVEQDRKEKALYGEAFCRAIVKATASDPNALERALRRICRLSWR